MPSDVLVVKNLTKRFGPKTIIQNLSFSMSWGQRVTLFARSGAGKTTLINILTRLEGYDEGQFTLTAQNPVTIFQEPRLFPYMTIAENIWLPAKLSRVAITPARQEQYRRWLEVCGLAEYTGHYPYQLSGGMKQKAAIIRGFLTGPDFVMLDEPFKSIDAASKQAIIDHLLATYPRTAVLFVTHNPVEIPLLTQSLLFFKDAILSEFTEMDAAALKVELDPFTATAQL